MTDLHTHILPRMDDGARDAAESLVMLRMAAAQGVRTVCLTPHFYRHRERPAQFLARRRAAMEELQEAIYDLPAEEQAALPELVLGAEVAFAPGLAEWDEIFDLCYAGTRTLLLEMPFSPWGDGVTRALYDLTNRTGITPVIAHLERYRKRVPENQIEDVLALGFPAQTSADRFLHMSSRRQALRDLEDWAYVVATDCHDPARRPPNMSGAMDVIRRRLGDDTVDALTRHAAQLLKPF